MWWPQRGGGALLLDYGYGEESGRLSAKPCRRWAGTDLPMCWPTPAKTICPRMSILPPSAGAARHGGAAVYGPRAQGEFLADLGITGRAEQLMATNPAAAQTCFPRWSG